MDTQTLKPQESFKPAEYAEHQLLEAILNKNYPPGSRLPGERVLAERLGVTRPTLREALQRLSREGWITIAQGKTTRVNDYFKDGGLALLVSMVRHSRNMDKGLVSHLLEVRLTLLPGVARLAADRHPRRLMSYLKGEEELGDDPDLFAEFDWGLQLLLAELTDNPVFRLILNDFTPMYTILGRLYFKEEKARKRSRRYYRELMDAVWKGGAGTDSVVRSVMEDSIEFFKELSHD
ncbi:MAG: hypothetical protein B6230_08045 [Desulfobacteraceae bacterium 4572_89]|nr:MAG: hypothetical protein B6230_08045 [Desulfobacteraceae bacterium 4572_89]